MNKTLTGENPIKLVLCECGKLHVTYGAITLHLTRDEFLVFAESVRRVAAIMAQPSLGQASVITQSNPSQVCH